MVNGYLSMLTGVVNAFHVTVGFNVSSDPFVNNPEHFLVDGFVVQMWYISLKDNLQCARCDSLYDSSWRVMGSLIPCMSRNGLSTALCY